MKRPTRRALRFWVALLALGAWLVSAGCKRQPAVDDLPVESEEEKNRPLPALTLTDETPDLLLTWIDDRGDAHVVHKLADVAPEGRAQVRVVVTTREEGNRSKFYVANLNAKNPDGSYQVTTMPRSEWDAIITKRRQAFAQPAGSANPDEPTPGDNGASASGRQGKFTVIVYGASWCGACHEAVAYLKNHKVPVIEKDIEQDPAANSEMQTKLARAGVHGGSIPVIDVKGKILIGFEPHALEAAMRGAGAVTL